MSTLSATTLKDRASGDENPVLDAVHGSARAWVNFNGTGTVAIRASYNVTSITDHGTGDYTVNFTTALPDTSFSMTGACSVLTGGNSPCVFDNTAVRARTTSSVSVRTIDVSAFGDGAWVSLSVFR